MLIALEVIFCLAMSIVGTALGECLFHKYLFHKDVSLLRNIPKLWNYTPSKHTHHHKVCFQEMEDKMDPEEDYWVQRPSNVFIAGCIIFSVESVLLWAFGLGWPFFLMTAIFTAASLTFWYKFEDHFHLAMHKNDYYMKNIHGTWKDSWFKYCKSLHEIHHKNFSYNYGFVFFPIGDLILGTYCNDYEKINKERVKTKK